MNINLVGRKFMLFSYEAEIKKTKFTDLKFFDDIVTVIGKQADSKLYVVHCKVCAEDVELYKKGLFTTSLPDLRRGQIPCGCARNPSWTEGQQLIRAHRLANERGFAFKGWYGEYNRNKTYCIFECEKHGEWTTTTIGGACKTGSCCPYCALDRIGKCNIKSDIDMVEGFFNSGSFHINTVFSRSLRLNRKGYPDYWYVECPVCNTVNESLAYHLKCGKLPCACSSHSQKQAYINLISDGKLPIALKFGIARNSTLRIEKQERMSVYSVDNYGIWEFESVRDCKDAEKEIKATLSTNILSKQEFKDGYTETTHVYNLDDIVKIFESYGGIKINNFLR